MADILPFQKRDAKRTTKSNGSTLCRQGHHKWEIRTERKFDVRQGRLVTEFVCKRCGKKKVKAL